MADDTNFKNEDPADIHPDFDRSNKLYLARFILLSHHGWKFRRGRGPRHHQFCLYCRGDLSNDCEILIHEDGECQNAWPVSCFLSILNTEPQHRASAIRCPMCRKGLFNRADYLTLATLKENDCPTASIWLSPFAPDFVLDSGLKEKRQIIFMERDHMQGLKLFGSEQEKLTNCLAICRTPDNDIELKREDRLSGCGPPSFNYLLGAFVLIHFGNNIFRMCTFLPDDMEQLRARLVAGGADVRLWSAETFKKEASQRGGLLACLEPDILDQENGYSNEVRKAGEIFMCGQEKTARRAWEPYAKEVNKAGVESECGNEESVSGTWKQYAYFNLLEALVTREEAMRIENSSFRAYLSSPRRMANLRYPSGLSALDANFSTLDESSGSEDF